MKYHLITTADEQSWKFNHPVIFLGEWCRTYNQKDTYSKLDYIVAPPYGLGQKNKDVDHAEARSLEEILFPIFCGILNKYHGTHHSLRFWKIVAGHWFRRYIEVILNRVRTLQQCLNNFEIYSTTALISSPNSLASFNSLDATSSFGNDQWNNLLYIEIINLLKINVEIENTNVVYTPVKKDSTSRDFKKTLADRFKKTIAKSSLFFTRKNDALIISTYLPKEESIKLHFSLKQVPQYHIFFKFIPKNSVSNALRRKLSNKIKLSTDDELLNISASLVFKLLPICYLEGFSELTKKAEKMRWPTQPKFIFTSNSFDFNEVFKVWTALKVEKGVKYIVGQHGNNYGTSRYMNPSIEEITSDKFLTWGWNDNLPQHTPAFILKEKHDHKLTKKKYYDDKGGLLLMEFPSNDRLFTTWDSTYEYIEYFKEQQAFLLKLKMDIRDNTTVRLHSSHHLMSWNDESRWFDFDQNLKIDSGMVPIKELLKLNRLVVHSYDSTGMLETLFQNIPTIAFWKNNFDHLRSNVISDYQLLLDVGIIHLNVDSVTNMIDKIWDDIDGWWMQDNVQNAREIFCKKYANLIDDPIHDLRSILEEK